MKFLILSAFLFMNTCTSPDMGNDRKEMTEKEKYWYAGEAELSNYELKQARYGEIRDGHAVMVFVTEPFSKSSMAKADNPDDTDVSVLKLNLTKNFNTGIYPYSMMTSTFFPFEKSLHSIKVSSSTQEWCGQTYMELQNKDKFDIKISSYFESESGDLSLAKNLLEDDIWSKIRLSPEDLPEGKAMMIPSFFHLRLGHVDTKAYECMLTKIKVSDEISSYKVQYREVDRELIINYETKFPHRILSWEESSYSGSAQNRKKLTTTGKLIKTMKTDYWNKNAKKDEALRTELGLK